MQTMKPGQCAQILTHAIAARQPMILWGAPGIGKSALTAQTARNLGRKVRDIRASLLDPVDLRGIPHIENGKTSWASPSFLPTVEDGPMLLLLDEMNRAPVMVQNALFQLVLDRKLGEYTLPDTCEIVACCNRESDGGGVVKMPQALSNRFVHVEMCADLDDWCKWAVTANIEPSTVAFLRFRPDLLHQFSRTDRAFPTPRSWEFVSRITARKPGNGIEHAMYSGAVGEGAAVEYSAFLRLFRELPNVDAILLNPTGAQLPTQPATMFAVASALARRASVTNFARVLQYMNRLSQEYMIYCVVDAVTRDQDLKATPEFTKWAIEHSEVLF